MRIHIYCSYLKSKIYLTDIGYSLSKKRLVPPQYQNLPFDVLNNQFEKMTEEQMMFLQKAISLSRQGMEAGKGGPFGCVIVQNGKIVGQGYNMVTSTNDPTAHGEVVAIRNACKNLGTFKLTGCDVYTSCEPCPMCFGAIGWSGAARIFYANTKKDAGDIGFIDDFLYEELAKTYQERSIQFHHFPLESALSVFKSWTQNQQKIKY